MPNMPRKQTAQVLVADLTWADLYAASIRKDVKMLIPAVKKISTRADLTESAVLLRQQLESAKCTTAELKKMTRLEPGHSDRSGSDR
jgi:hypothetical protein